MPASRSVFRVGAMLAILLVSLPAVASEGPRSDPPARYPAFQHVSWSTTPDRWSGWSGWIQIFNWFHWPVSRGHGSKPPGGQPVVHSAPGPVAGVGLPVLAVAGGYVWLRRRRKRAVAAGSSG